MPSGNLHILALTSVLVFAGCAAHATQAARDMTSDAAPMPSASNESRGSELFAKNCEACHGARGAGGPVGPALAAEHKLKDFKAVVSAIERPDPPMPKLFPGTLSAQDVADLAAYVESL
jgi:mono/diheme cytochrome c family protein